MAQDIGKDYRDPLLASDDGTFRISGWNGDGDCSILLPPLVLGKVISPSDMVLSSNQTDDWRWGGQAINPPGAVTPATLAQIGATGCYAYEYDNGDAMAFHDLQLPHWYAEGTAIPMHIHWVPSTTEAYSGTWTLVYVDWLNAATGADMVGPTTITAAFNVAGATANRMITTSFTPDIPGTGRKISSMAHATLTLSLTKGASCFLCGLDGHPLKDRLGSRTEWTK